MTEACEYGETSCEVCNDTCNWVAGVTSYCGDSTVNGSESCDDGNAVTEACEYGETSCEVCNDTCNWVAGVTAYCGDGFVDTAEGEVCDESGPTALCTVNCTLETSFISIWRTTTNNETITLPLRDGFDYNFNVDWGDGSVSNLVTSHDDPDATHTYVLAGEHTITISGRMETIYFNDAGDKDKIISILNLGDVGWTSFQGAFKGCLNLESVAGGVTSEVTNMAYMFYGASLANPDTSNWVTSNVTSIASMFRNATSANPDTSGWNTSNMTQMGSVFAGASSATPNTSGWDTSKVKKMELMFDGASSATPDTSDWDTSQVTTMWRMFSNATLATPDTSGWDTKNVRSMAMMFFGAAAANPDTSDWDTSSVTSMASMFSGALSAAPDTSDWDTSSVTNMESMFLNTMLSVTHYSNFLLRVEATNQNNGVELHGGTATYNFLAGDARQRLIDEHGWTIVDGGLEE